MNMKLASYVVVLFLLAILSACTPKEWVLATTRASKIAMDSTKDARADTLFKAYIQPLKQRIDAQMNEVIGISEVEMRAAIPESLLSNFNADVYRQMATRELGQAVDIAIVNVGGLRTIVPKGNITVRKVFELMPFENELVVLSLRGDKLLALIQQFARVGGQGVSGVRFVIANGKAENISVNGKPLNETILYTIATNDYLAGGNDKMVQLLDAEKRVNTGLKIRDVLISYIKSETQKGHAINAQLDGRIVVAQ